MSPRVTPAAGAYALLLLVVVVFNPAFGNRFINLDDPDYITRNPMVQSGFTCASLRWAFTSFDAANWHPLTWLSHLVDTELFGSLPFGSHLMNVLYHAATTALLFVLVHRLTGAFWPSFFTAALFGVHPLRVESVAWAAERKDVLSGCFWMLTLLAYVAFVRRRGTGRYLLVIGTFTLGLMAKPMLVTLPVVLLILDRWPLGRTLGPGPLRLRLGGLLLEKLPLFMLSALSSFITILAQSSGGAVISLRAFPLGKRLANAAVATTSYIAATAWPANLAILYPWKPEGTPLAAAAGAGLLLALATAAALKTSRRRPYLLSGWLWYLVALLPVLGLIQVGMQPRADRYTYLPAIGITLAVIWLSADLARRQRRLSRFLAVAGAAAVVAGSGATHQYLAVWRDGEQVFRKALAVGGDNLMMHFCLAGELAQAGKIDEAVTEFARCVALAPGYANGHFGLGYVLDLKGEIAEAAAHYRKALEINPHQAEVHKFLGDLLARSGDPTGAEVHLREALRIQPLSPEALESLCRLRRSSGEPFAIPLFPACGGEIGEWWAQGAGGLTSPSPTIMFRWQSSGPRGPVVSEEEGP